MLKQALKRVFRGSTETLTPEAQAELARDRQGLPEHDPGPDIALRAAAQWLCRAQDNNRLGDRGVARHYSLMRGWASSYPETTGYVVPTMFALAQHLGDEEYRRRGQEMLDWLVSIQLPGGGFQGGLVDSTPVVPVTFNTGQILIGLAAGASEFGEKYMAAMHAAAEFLRDSQDSDGCWRKNMTPFAKPGEKAYETHVAWGLLEAECVAPGRGYQAAALRQIRWAMSHQRPNGWFESNCLTDNDQPLTHTIGYVLRGLLEGYRSSGDPAILDSAVRCADGAMSALQADGKLAGRLDCNWKSAVDWVCLTGSVQIATCWMKLFSITGEERYRDAGYAANRFVRKTIRLDGPDGIRGGIKGSFPVDGHYGRFEYLNWACKFFIDSNLLEQELRAAATGSR